MKKAIYLILFTIVVISCDKKEQSVFEDQNTTTEDTVVQEEIIQEPSVFNVSFDIVVPEYTELQLFYTVDEDTNFNEKNSKKKKIKGSADFQQVNFGLPRHATSIRLDLGQNEKNTNFKIQNFKFEANGYEYQIKENALNQFSGNEYVKINESDNSIQAHQINGKYDPFIVSKKELNTQLQDSLR